MCSALDVADAHLRDRAAGLAPLAGELGWMGQGVALRPLATDELTAAWGRVTDSDRIAYPQVQVLAFE